MGHVASGTVASRMLHAGLDDTELYVLTGELRTGWHAPDHAALCADLLELQAAQIDSLTRRLAGEPDPDDLESAPVEPHVR